MNCILDASFILTNGAGEHDGGVEEQVVRHDRGSDDSDSDVEDVLIRKYLLGGQVPSHHFDWIGIGQAELYGETNRYRCDQSEDDAFYPLEAFVLHEEDDQHVRRGDDDACDDGNVQEEVEGDG